MRLITLAASTASGREQREQLIRQVRNDGARLDEAEKLKGR
jgi:hypothetical protein